jgi:hypothetical protein
MTAANPWWKEPWPWILMAGPAIVVVASVVTIYLAVTTSDGLVVDDYYKRGLAINQVLARSDRARAAGLRARLALDVETGAVVVHLEGAEDAPAVLRLALAHPTRAGRDREITMMRGPDGSFVGRIDAAASRRWLVVLEDGARDWRLRGELTLPRPAGTILIP